METSEKIVAIFVSEIVMAIVFVMAIVILSQFPDPLNIITNIITALANAWMFLGLATPLVIGFELWNYLGNIKFQFR